MDTNKFLSLALIGLGAYFILSSNRAKAASWQDYIDITAKEEDIDPCIIKAIIKTESDGNVNAVRRERTGHDSIGLMQVTLPAARDVEYTGSEQGLFNPYTNIKYGTRYFKRMLNIFGGNIYKAIAAYNAGPTNVKHGRYSTLYVAQVLRFYSMCKAGIKLF